MLTEEKQKRKVRTGYNSEQSRNESFGLSLEFAKSQDEKIYACLREHGELTVPEIEDRTGIRYTSVHRSLNTLMKENLVLDTNRTRTNPLTGMPNTLWKHVEIDLKLF